MHLQIIQSLKLSDTLNQSITLSSIYPRQRNPILVSRLTTSEFSCSSNSINFSSTICRVRAEATPPKLPKWEEGGWGPRPLDSSRPRFLPGLSFSSSSSSAARFTAISGCEEETLLHLL